MAEQNQAAQRRYVIRMDQHGRRWGGSVEIKTDDYCGLIDYIENKRDPSDPTWSTEFPHNPPILPPQIYIEPVKNRRYDCRIRYDRWLIEVRARHEDWLRRAREQGRRLYQDKYDAQAPISVAVMDIIGPETLRPEVVIACSQGNPWMLGMVDTPDVRLEKYFARPKIEELDYSSLDLGTLEAGEATQAPTTRPPADPNKPFQCDLCEKAFGTERALVGHRSNVHRPMRVESEDPELAEVT